MNLQEQISRIKGMMNINESHKKIIYNLDLIELGGDIKDLPPKIKGPEIDVSDLNRQFKERTSQYKVDKKDDFSDSVVKDVVWRAGQLRLDPRAGGIWFADSKEGVEKFAWSVRNEKREGKPYHINLKNPYYFEDGFWHGYIDEVERSSRERFMVRLMSLGYDGIIIADDRWNDTGDEYSVYGKQYIVFDEDDVKPA